ncbi:oxidoreductase [Gorillibacterium timonense]|uniref:oxidoreductase n=1 Tax=Gorillibacterium timonense TaxID=1689269 RepID=UPI000AA5A49D|nr:oxidoreductase [Gorillibacterium timonense]
MTVSSPASSGNSALLLGASGLVGSSLLRLLLEDPACGRVTALVRRPLPIVHDKLRYVVADFDRLDEHSSEFAVDWVFCCLGTTIRKAGSQEAFARVDLDYPLAAARLSGDAGARSYHVISAAQADSRSRIFYSRIKGRMEEETAKLPLRELHIYRPSLLLGDRQEFRLGERVGSYVMRGLSLLFRGPLALYRAIQAEDLAKAMLASALDKPTPALVSSPVSAPGSGSTSRGANTHSGTELFQLAELYNSRMKELSRA